MIMQTVFVKDREGIAHTSSGQLSSVPLAPCWSTASFGKLKSSSMELSATGNQFSATKRGGKGTEQGLDQRNATQFTIFPGDGQKMQLQTALSMQPPLPEYQSPFELGLGQPMICTKYPYVDHCYGVLSTYGPQITGHIMLPLSLTTDDGPIYVNAKQYHGIIRRRQFRAKAELENKVSRGRKPYMHESRHLHALRRPRGCGGRFLNTKKVNGGTGEVGIKKAGIGQISQAPRSQNSEVLQSESENLNSSEANGTGSNISGSEVTSMYTREDINCFPFNPIRSSVHTLSDMVDTGHDIVMPSKWVAAAENCCNLNV